jgi:hypothetical protein
LVSSSTISSTSTTSYVVALSKRASRNSYQQKWSGYLNSSFSSAALARSRCPRPFSTPSRSLISSCSSSVSSTSSFPWNRSASTSSHLKTSRRLIICLLYIHIQPVAYEEGSLDFDTDYDRENPITKVRAIREFN